MIAFLRIFGGNGVDKALITNAKVWLDGIFQFFSQIHMNRVKVAHCFIYG
jgi:hypothetical protein